MPFTIIRRPSGNCVLTICLFVLFSWFLFPFTTTTIWKPIQPFWSISIGHYGSERLNEWFIYWKFIHNKNNCFNFSTFFFNFISIGHIKRLWPDHASAHNNLGALYWKISSPDKAEQHFQQALNINPYHAKAHFNLEKVFR